MTKVRCKWCIGQDIYEKYHDEEWGDPVYEDQHLYELLLLESFQAGLNWLTILKKREQFREAFDEFDYHKISKYTQKDVSRLLNNEEIVRHRGKIEASITNAKGFIKIQEEYDSFSKYIWGYVSKEPILNSFSKLNQVPSQTELSQNISGDLRKRGFKFLGPTTIYAFMQASGMVNDHLSYCFRHKKSV
jgi:DNA-3-methyladenine glycosylase I